MPTQPTQHPSRAGQKRPRTTSSGAAETASEDIEETEYGTPQGDDAQTDQDRQDDNDTSGE